MALDRSVVRRQAVVDAAMDLADRDGLEAVSMRNVAERLGVGTMTLYSYVESKGELLDRMIDEVSREMLVPDPLPEHWREALRAIALRTRDAFGRHPWIFGPLARRPRQGINTMRHIEQSVAAVAPLGADDATAGAILMAVDDYTIGHAARKHARRKMAGGRRPPEADFERGLDWLLDGIEADLAR